MRQASGLVERVEDVQMLLDARDPEGAAGLRPRGGDAEDAVVDLPLRAWSSAASAVESRKSTSERSTTSRGGLAERASSNADRNSPRCAGRARPGAARRRCRRPRAARRGPVAAARPGSPSPVRRSLPACDSSTRSGRTQPTGCPGSRAGSLPRMDPAAVSRRARGENFPVASLLFPRRAAARTCAAIYGFAGSSTCSATSSRATGSRRSTSSSGEVDALLRRRARVAADARRCSRRSASSRCRASRSCG